MKATTLIEAVQQMTGIKTVTEQFAKQYVFDNYMEFRMFTRHEDKMIEIGKEKINALKLNRERFKKMYSKN